MLNGTKEDVEMLKKRMEERRLRAKLEKVRRGFASAPELAANYSATAADAAQGTRLGLLSLGGPASRDRFRVWPQWASSPRQVGGRWLKAWRCTEAYSMA